MRVRDFMTTDLITVDVKTPIMEALGVMKDNRVKRLPVTKSGKFVGLVTRNMIRDASPSKATSLSVHELNYILFKMTVDHLMVKKPVTVSPHLPLEEAIWLGIKHGVGALPVLESGKLVGIITESDISRIVIEALGLGERDSQRITIDASGKRFGYLPDLVRVLDTHRIPILSLMGIPKSGSKDWMLILRVKTKDAARAIEDLRQEGFKVTDVT
ncbi:MAG: CBS domain-containing protein [Deltaproteobacteria bacterium]|nr:MAG: CBS domain-containing protein [Deltaproteobacteria bacterium]